MSTFSAYRYFHFHNVFVRTKAFIDRHNEKQSKLTDKLNANHRATAELIIRLYLKQLNSVSKNIGLNENDIPGFKTYNSSLASCKGCTSRTIINHKERLNQSGFIVKEEHCGAQGIELWINPDILNYGQEVACEIQSDFLENNSKATSFSIKGKNFHPLVHEPHEQRNNNSTVDSVRGVLPHMRDHSNGLDKSETTRTLQEPVMNTGENAKSISKDQKITSGEVDRISLLVLVQQFWVFAQKVLFPDLILSEPEKRDIMNMIWAAVYQKFHGSILRKQWMIYHEQAMERIIMVRKWLDRSPNHWIPPPHVYFSPYINKTVINRNNIG